MIRRTAKFSSSLFTLLTLMTYLLALPARVPAQTASPTIAQYQADLKRARDANDRPAEAEALHSLGAAYKATGQAPKALEYETNALAIYRELKDRRGEASTISAIGEAYGAIGQPKTALEFLNQALPINRDIGDQSGESHVLTEMGQIYNDTGEPKKALDLSNRALQLSREVHDSSEEANALYVMGEVYTGSSPSKALDSLNEALSIRRKLGDRSGEGTTLNAIGEAYWASGQAQKALEFCNQALPIEREVGSRVDVAVTLTDIGVFYGAAGQPRKELEFYDQALLIERELGKRNDEAATLNNIGATYIDISEPKKALDYYNQALPIWREVGDVANEGKTVYAIGEVYRDLAQPQKALEFYNQALSIEQKASDRRAEALTLSAIAIVYRDTGERQKALEFLGRSLPIQREVGDERAAATTLHNMGTVYLELGQREKARKFYNEALPIEREGNDPVQEAYTRWRLASLDGSLDEYLDALRVAQQAENLVFQGLINTSIMDYYRAHKQPAIATYFGKQAVNAIQAIRSDIRGFDPDVQKIFLQANEKPYHTLVDLLMEQGRLTEAEEVLNLLKEEEYLDFVRRDTAESSSLSQHADLTREESDWEKRYREISDKLVALATERGELVGKKNLTPEEARRLAQVEQDLAVGNSAFEKFLDELAGQFSTTAAASAKVDQFREAQGIMEDLRELPEGTVAIYTLVGDDKYRSILVTPDVQKAYEYPIKASDLNRKILDFRQVAENPTVDPRPKGQELYNILLANLAEDLKQAKAKTVMWSLDGALRYLPVAALYDGKRYLVEEYGISVFTPASNARLKDRPDRDWTAAGFGVTRPHEGASALPDVAIELTSIIAEKPGQGILRGEVKLDDQFTQDAMRQTLLKHYPVVHIASHFRFQPGNETNSFLLLGDGNHLSLADMKNLPNLFGGVQLLTLSACNTGLGDTSADGKEVEGLGVLAQRKGAKAVVASLWSVADISTSLLMQEFYRTRESGTTTKVEALRQAQLAMLKGTLKSDDAATAHRELLHEDSSKADLPGLAHFTADPKAPYAHPYYWAPFFLMGNSL